MFSALFFSFSLFLISNKFYWSNMQTIVKFIALVRWFYWKSCMALHKHNGVRSVLSQHMVYWYFNIYHTCNILNIGSISNPSTIQHFLFTITPDDFRPKNIFSFTTVFCITCVHGKIDKYKITTTCKVISQSMHLLICQIFIHTLQWGYEMISLQI